MNKTLIASSGEHYVAYRLSCLGYLVALVRQGSPSIDLLASTSDGVKTIGIQVKTTTNAVRFRGKGENKRPHELQFPLGHNVFKESTNSIIYCFVDLKIPSHSPEIYIIDGRTMYLEYATKYQQEIKYLRHHRELSEMDKYLNNWSPIEKALGTSIPPVDSL